MLPLHPHPYACYFFRGFLLLFWFFLKRRRDWVSARCTQSSSEAYKCPFSAILKKKKKTGSGSKFRDFQLFPAFPSFLIYAMTLQSQGPNGFRKEFNWNRRKP